MAVKGCRTDLGECKGETFHDGPLTTEGTERHRGSAGVDGEHGCWADGKDCSVGRRTRAAPV